MKIYEYGFIGHDMSSTTVEWAKPDSLETFIKNKKNMPDLWYYNHNSFNYVRNSLGHRSKEIKDLNFDNYILFVGCSNTEGIGVDQNHTYAAVLSSMFNCDFYNMGLSATGMDVVMHNLTIWFSVFKKRPKFVIIQWPDYTRCMTIDSSMRLYANGHWSNDKDYVEFVNFGTKVKYFDAKKMMMHHVVKNMVDVPTVYFGMNHLIPFNDQTLLGDAIDRGRDLLHPGIKSHQQFAETIYQFLTK